ncbi:hypothetical protein Kisp01_55630 [Kineosporia sp. NBRC 101677]|nr:hypothetical protein Kisp01_55630 [Kineosporia sp. NBRC 101677]
MVHRATFVIRSRAPRFCHPIWAGYARLSIDLRAITGREVREVFLRDGSGGQAAPTEHAVRTRQAVWTKSAVRTEYAVRTEHAVRTECTVCRTEPPSVEALTPAGPPN